jgi:hypothetical protein
MDLARVFDRKKFMWDGKVYTDEKERGEIAEKYINDGFEVEIVEEDTQYFLFTRKLITEVIAEGQPT